MYILQLLYRRNKLLAFVMLVVLVLLGFTYYTIEIQSPSGPDLTKVMRLVLLDLIVLLLLVILLSKKFFKRAFDAKGGVKGSSKLRNRIIVTFSLIAAVPTIVVAIFSTYFFNFGIQSWFDQKISKVLDQSIIVAQSYIAEHTLQLKQTALSTSEDLNEMYYDLVHDVNLFTKVLNAQAEMRSLDEAIVFQKSTNTVLAQTSLSFSLSFLSIPLHLIDRADRGEIVDVKSDPQKMRMLIKLNSYHDTYLLIGRLIDEKIIEHIDQTNGAAKEYNRLKSHISNMQIKFSIVFVLLALILLVVAITCGVIFASYLVSPIQRLVIATEKAKDGDLTVQVPEDNVSKDEISILSTAFNRMMKQISRQQRELVVAQRALAWSDVARKVAHEIKNPLTPIQLSADRLLKKFSSEVSDESSFNKYVNTIIRHTNDIKTIVAEFVNFARLPAPVFSKIDLVVLIKEIVSSRSIIKEKIRYTFNSDVESLNFVCDSLQMHQVMVNLLKNAEESIEHVDEQAIDVSITNDRKNRQVMLCVKDSGIGFAPDILENATEAYITNRAKGTGLGLAIVKKIIQDHCGTISISNIEPNGAAILMTFDIEDLNSKVS